MKAALKELDRYEKLPASSAESGVIRNYMDWLLALPWTDATEDMIDLAHSEEILNKDHYGLEKVKRARTGIFSGTEVNEFIKRSLSFV